MLTVEDCLEKLDELQWEDIVVAGQYVKVKDSWDQHFINDVCFHTRDNKSLSTAQGDIALKLIGRYRWQLEQIGCSEQSITDLLRSPVYRHPPYQSTVVQRQVRWLGDNKLAFRSKYNSHITNDIKKLRGTNHFQVPREYPYFNRELKLWIVDVNSGNYEKIMDLIKRYKFEFDSDVENFFLEVANSAGQPSSYEIEGDDLIISVRDDDVLSSWLNSIIALDPDNV